jgi:hypothetical protein
MAARSFPWLLAIPLALATGVTCQPPPRMNGGGELAVGGELVGIALNVGCAGSEPRYLEVGWSRGEFRLTELAASFCRDDPALDPGTPVATFDTLTGGGFGTWRGAAGAHASFTFADAGEGALPDYAELTITAPDGEVVLDAAGVVQGGLEARGRPVLAEAPGEDPTDARHAAVVDAAGRSWGLSFARLPASAFVEEPQAVVAKPGGTPTAPPKVHPVLAAQVASGDPDDRAQVLMNRFDPEVLHALPDLWRALRCDDPLRAQIDPRLAAAIDLLRLRRELATESFLADFRGGAHDIRVAEQFWLVNGFVADLRLGDVADLAARDDVLFLQPAHLGTAPPAIDDGDPGNDILVGRQLVNSDFLRAQPGLDGGCIGLLDTGVRQTHVLFSAPPRDNLRFELTDCDGGGPSCQDGGLPTFHPQDGWNHGTGTLSILSGNDVYGPRFRGVTDVQVDSWKVYHTGSTTVIGDGPAAVVGFQRALESQDRVIVAELQHPEPATGMVATAADNAFELGAVVVAAAGNCAVDDDCSEPEGTPQPGTIRSPAIAHKVIGVGAYRLGSLDTPDYQSSGPTEDLRVKPEIQAPTDAEAASQCGYQDASDGTARGCVSASAPDLSLLRHGGTSGSTPFAGGVAALIRNALRKLGTWEPGHTYARMILKADRTSPYHAREGAGRLQLDVCTVSHWGKVKIVPNVQTLGNVPAVLIPIEVASGFDRIEAAIWWPEKATASHDDVDLYWVDPNGVEVAQGVHDHGVFERVEVADPVGGSWTLKIKSYTYLSLQQIYWAADLVGCDVAIAPTDLPPLMP